METGDCEKKRDREELANEEELGVAEEEEEGVDVLDDEGLGKPDESGHFRESVTPLCSNLSGE